MPWIQNVPMSAVITGIHNTSDKQVLIQIVDPGYDFPVPMQQFTQVHQFQFLDLTHNCLDFNSDGTCKSINPAAITQIQAAAIADILTQSLASDTNIVVHCHAGLCRSGAVAEVGIMLGFTDTNKTRIPNIFVKQALMAQLGMSYNNPFEENNE